MGTNFYNADATASNNTTIGGVGVQGSNSPSNFDNALREMHSQTKKFALDLGGANTVGGTADAITITTNQVITAYVDGLIVPFIAGEENTLTTATANVDGLGAKAIKKAVDGVETAIAAGDIQGGGLYILRYRSAWESSGGAWQFVDFNTVKAVRLSEVVPKTGGTFTGDVEIEGTSPHLTLSDTDNSASVRLHQNSGVARLYVADSTGVAGGTLRIHGQNSAADVDSVTIRKDGADNEVIHEGNIGEYVLGVGQTWQNVMGSRSGNNTSYQNTTGRPIMVSIRHNDAAARTLSVSSDNVNWVNTAIGSNAYWHTINAVIPDGHYYKTTASSLLNWVELR